MKKRKFILLSLIVSAFVLVNLNVVSKKVNGKIGMTLNQLIQSVKADEECSVLNAPCVFDCCWGLHCEMGTCKSNVEWKEVPCHWEAWCGGTWMSCDGEMWACAGDPYGGDDCGIHVMPDPCDCIPTGCE